MNRRGMIAGIFTSLAAAGSALAEPLFWFDEGTTEPVRKPRRKRLPDGRPSKKKQSFQPTYQGRRVVSYFGDEAPGTIIIKTRERALYRVLGDGRAMRYLVAVGKEGFAWSGVARVGRKQVEPPWTPPPEMIERKPEYEEWADGMPGGIPENPLGARAMYLYRGKTDTLFRIHGTNNPSSIGTAASSGCIRMLNREVIELYNDTPVGTKVIVL